MAEKKYEPPKCPGCGQPLEFVYETSYETYTFDPETDSYKGNLNINYSNALVGLDLTAGSDEQMIAIRALYEGQEAARAAFNSPSVNSSMTRLRDIPCYVPLSTSKMIEV